MINTDSVCGVFMSGAVRSARMPPQSGHIHQITAAQLDGYRHVDWMGLMHELSFRLLIPDAKRVLGGFQE